MVRIIATVAAVTAASAAFAGKSIENVETIAIEIPEVPEQFIVDDGMIGAGKDNYCCVDRFLFNTYKSFIPYESKAEAEDRCKVTDWDKHSKVKKLYLKPCSVVEKMPEHREHKGVTDPGCCKTWYNGIYTESHWTYNNFYYEDCKLLQDNFDKSGTLNPSSKRAIWDGKLSCVQWMAKEGVKP